jgi:hypothetical protein
VSGAHRLRRALEGPPDAARRTAAAPIARQLLAALPGARGRVGDEKRLRGPEHPGAALAARRRRRRDEGRRPRLGMLGRAAARDREALAPPPSRAGATGADQGALDGDGAGPAGRALAAELGGMAFERVAQPLAQGGVGGDIHHVGPAMARERACQGTLQGAWQNPAGVCCGCLVSPPGRPGWVHADLAGPARGPARRPCPDE